MIRGDRSNLTFMYIAYNSSFDRFRSPPPQLAVPTEFAPLQRDLPKSTSIRQNEVAPEGGDNKKELRIRRCSERKEAPVACAESASNPLKKKKTVAFGRTINVSQTVEVYNISLIVLISVLTVDVRH